MLRPPAGYIGSFNLTPGPLPSFWSMKTNHPSAIAAGWGSFRLFGY
jgi:hypothetical protein